MATLVNGTVKWFNSINSNGYDRVSLNEGQKVTFEVTEGEKGLQAENVTGL